MDVIGLIDLIDFYNFMHLILRNYLSDCNETYKHYRGGVEIIYQFQAILNFDKNVGILHLKTIDAFYVLVGV